MAWLIALASSLAVLFIGEVMGQTPCDLCWFQRAFMFPLVFVLGVSCLNETRGAWQYGLPLAIGGFGVAAFHSLLYAGLLPARIKPCSEGVSCSGPDMAILGGLPLPMLALAAFSAIAGLLLIARTRAT